MRTWTDRPVLRPLLAAAACAALLSACQTGTEPDDEAPSATTQAPGAPTEPDGEGTDDGDADADTSEPDDAADDGAPDGGTVNGPNSITSPTPGATVEGPEVTVTGEGTAFEATLNYRVLVARTTDVVLGPDYTMAGANGEIGPFTIELSLDPGEYTVQVWEPDMTGGEGEGDDPGDERHLVEVTFTVS